ncbi:MAG: ATPase [Candidatus Odinarchaeum yellowstonii]|uniref:ATPase n=1 Tax=Odinarchaeota yellowstonii (strain LCB_4) TaxID=1841599 RepID=A0AAF0D300_ODILC|nr:MAG: ATPase [Candidatus Odinarchaeum yellowstonii]
MEEEIIFDRVKTGIPGLDGILHGGFIRGNNILVSGSAGTGKTIMCLQYIVSGIMNYNEPGVFVTSEELPYELRREALQFGWDLKKLEEEGKLIIIDAASAKAGLPTDEKYAIKRGFEVNELAEQIYTAVNQIQAKRLVLDSLSGLDIKINDPQALRVAIFKISALLRELGVTSIMTSEMLEDHSFSRYGVEEFIAQGVILLYLKEQDGELRRSLIVLKMRSTAHSLRRYPFEITSLGIVVMPGEEI